MFTQKKTKKKGMMERFQDKVNQDEMDGNAANQIVDTFTSV